MTRTRVFLLSLTLALACAPAFARAATLTASPALTATAAPAGAKAPVATPVDVQVQLWPAERGGAQLVISADLAENTRLPATVRIPLPAGAEPGWVGEVSGGDISGDILRQFTIEKGDGGQVLVLTLEKYRSAQVEANFTAPTAIGGKMASTLDWVQSAPAATTHFAVKMTTGTADVAIDPVPTGAPQQNDAGERLYTVASRHLDPGKTFTMTATFAYGAQTAATTASGGGGGSTVLVVLVALLAAAVMAFVVVAVRSRTRPVAAPEARARRTARRGDDTDAPDENDPFQL